MVPYRTLLDTVSSVVCTLDVIDQCDSMVLVDSMTTAAVTDGDAWEILQKMENSGLVVLDATVVAITSKGRYLAGDIRTMTGKVVRG